MSSEAFAREKRLSEEKSELEKRLAERDKELSSLKEALRLREEEIRSITARASQAFREEEKERPVKATVIAEQPRLAAEPEPIKAWEVKRESRRLEERRTPWMVKCDKCGTQQSIELAREQAAELWQGGTLVVECANRNCMDGKEPHRIKLDLNKLI